MKHIATFNDNKITLQLPIKVISEANARDHWKTRWRRNLAQSTEVGAEWLNLTKRRPFPLPCVVRFTRIAPKWLDSDALVGSFKHVRDEVARRLGVDDGDTTKVSFEYDQAPLGRNDYWILIEVRPA